jgi:UDP-glucuronate 4-epimerase
MTVLVTGAAGFIGYHCARALLDSGRTVIGVDSLNDYYDPALKQARLARLRHQRFRFVQADVADREAMLALAAGAPEVTEVLHLAAQAGVRYSMIDPYAYVTANVMGQVVVLEAARALPRLRHVVFASSSSVYGLNTALPFAEADRVDRPSSLYAATKRAGELIGHAYRHLYGLPQTGLRFFTVYGPWGRPDMAYFAFGRAILRGEPIIVYDGGRVRRDFTWIGDIVDGVIRVLDRPPPAGEGPAIFNIGNHRSEPVSELVRLLEAGLGRAAVVREGARPAADVAETWADVDALGAWCGWAPTTPLSVGVPRFCDWLLEWEKGG